MNIMQHSELQYFLFMIVFGAMLFFGFVISNHMIDGECVFFNIHSNCLNIAGFASASEHVGFFKMISSAHLSDYSDLAVMLFLFACLIYFIFFGRAKNGENSNILYLIGRAHHLPNNIVIFPKYFKWLSVIYRERLS